MVHSTYDRLLHNARIVLQASCRAQPGESLVILMDEALRSCAPALAEAAVSLGLLPVVIDITHFAGSPAYRQGRLLEPLRAAIRAADIVIANTRDVHDATRADYGKLLGQPDAHDLSLSGERRWFYLQPGGMESWDVECEDVARLRQRTLRLLDLLKRARTGKITSALGSDFTFSLAPPCAANPILGIVPFYAEVAVVPSLVGTGGILMVDGPSQLDVRPASETDRTPLRIEICDGRMIAADGDPEQVQRLHRFVASGDPPADAVDEVGIVTTHFVENDLYYWSDGTHHHDRVHVALGNNARRDVVVHGPRHMDLEISKPTIEIDGIPIVCDGLPAA